MEDDFNKLKPAFAAKSVYNWNVEDLKNYKEQLKAEIVKLTKFSQQNKM